MEFSRWRSLPVLVAFALIVSGCGFQLRSATAFPPQMSRIYIDASDRYTPFYREVSNAIRASDADIVRDPLSADSVIHIHRDLTGRRSLSVSIRNIPREYEIYYTVDFSVDINEVEVLTPQTLTLTRDYTYDETVVLGKEREERILRDAIASDLVGLMQQRISTVR